MWYFSILIKNFSFGCRFVDTSPLCSRYLVVLANIYYLLLWVNQEFLETGELAVFVCICCFYDRGLMLVVNLIKHVPDILGIFDLLGGCCNSTTVDSLAKKWKCGQSDWTICFLSWVISTLMYFACFLKFTDQINHIFAMITGWNPSFFCCTVPIEHSTSWTGYTATSLSSISLDGSVSHCYKSVGWLFDLRWF